MKSPHITIAHTGKILGAHNGVQVIACDVCHFAHQSPLPKPKIVHAHYANGFYETEKPDYLKREYADAEWLNLWHTFELEMIAEQITTKSRRLLDVGCGFGTLIQTAEIAKWNCFGVEPSARACKTLSAARISHFNAPIEEVDLDPHAFDAIRAAFVFEHLLDPRAVLVQLVAALKVGGVIALTVPNDFTDIQRATQDALKKPAWWIAPSHINYFNTRSLARLMEDAGLLAPVALAATFPVEWLALAGWDYIGNEPVGRDAHGIRKRAELALAQTDAGKRALRDLATAFANAGIGRDVLVIGRKEDE